MHSENTKSRIEAKNFRVAETARRAKNAVKLEKQFNEEIKKINARDNQINQINEYTEEFTRLTGRLEELGQKETDLI